MKQLLYWLRISGIIVWAFLPFVLVLAWTRSYWIKCERLTFGGMSNDPSGRTCHLVVINSSGGRLAIIDDIDTWIGSGPMEWPAWLAGRIPTNKTTDTYSAIDHWDPELKWVRLYKYDFLSGDSLTERAGFYYSNWSGGDPKEWQQRRIILQAPYSAVVTVAAIPGWWLLAIQSKLRRAWRARRGMCGSCGYDLRGGNTTCPECGTPVIAS